MQEFLNQTFLNNTLLVYIIAIGILIVGILGVNIFRKIVLSRLKIWAEKTETTIDDFLVNNVEKTVVPLLYYGAFYLAARTLTLSPKILTIFNSASIIILTFFFLKATSSFLNYTLLAFIKRKGHGEEKQKEAKGISTIITIIVWGLGIVFLLDNLGFQVSAIIAGLGVGGIAIALAAQAVLGDLFAYFVIFFDRPFEIGDFIIVGDKVGAVEFVGIKTTRIRSLGGEQLVFSNKDLTDSRIHNYKKMERRRVVFKLGVTYQTTIEHLKVIPKIIREIIESQEKATFDRGHFATYGDFSLNFEFVYYVLGADYNQYMDIQQAINLAIFEEFENRGIEFAYPTQTLFLTGTNNLNEETHDLRKRSN